MFESLKHDRPFLRPRRQVLGIKSIDSDQCARLLQEDQFLLDLSELSEGLLVFLRIVRVNYSANP